MRVASPPAWCRAKHARTQRLMSEGSRLEKFRALMRRSSRVPLANRVEARRRA